MPFGLALLAAVLAIPMAVRVMPTWAPMICLLAGLGAAVLVGWGRSEKPVGDW